MDPVVIDLETRSPVDLRKAGGGVYAACPATRLVTVAWTADMGLTYHVYVPGLAAHKRPLPEFFEANLPGVTVHDSLDALAPLAGRPWVGHNCWTFDRPVWEACVPGIRPVRWIDTYPLAMSAGLPGGLDAIGKRLWGEGKYDGGKSDCLASSKSDMNKPATWGPEVILPVTQLRIARYNVQDVKLTVELYKMLCRDAVQPPGERAVLRAHDVINTRGCRVDRPMIKALIDFAVVAKTRAVDKIVSLTGGGLPNVHAVQSPAKVKAWLGEMGVSLGSSLRKEIVARFIEEHEEDRDDEVDDSGPDDGKAGDGGNLPLVLKVLELRLQAMRVTGGKLDAAFSRVTPDDRLCHLFAYWAAHTGRWGGRGVQVQNLPRPKEGVDVWHWVSRYEATGRLDYDEVEAGLPKDKALYRFLTPDDVSSALLRSIFLPDAGDTLAAADLSNIEARVLAYLAGESWLMKAFEQGDDPYLHMAGGIFGPKETWPKFPDPKKPGQFLPLKKHPYRQVGKVVVLGCGYQLGVDKFALYAAANGIDLSAVGTRASACIYAYRRAHPAIAGPEAGEYEGKPYFKGGYWDRLNDAAISAVVTNREVPVGPVSFRKEGTDLIVTLPSGRRLRYRDASVYEKDFYGKPKTTVMYRSSRGWTVDMYGGKWAENIVQAVSRDVLAHGMVLLESIGVPVVLHVHDEVPCSTRPGRFGDYMAAVTTCPEWLPDFPLDAEGSCAPRYAKSPPPGVVEEVWRNGRKR